MLARNYTAGAAALTLAAGVLGPLAAEPAAAQSRVTLKSASAESSYYVMTVQLAEMIREQSEGEVIPTVEESQGSVQNVREAARRPGAFFFTTPPSLLHKAEQGAAPFDDGGDYSGIRTLFPMPFVTIHFVVRAETGIDNVTDLKGKTFIAGGTGTFCHQRSTAILDALGLSHAVDTPDMELSGAPAALRNKQAAGYVTCSSHPTPQLQELGTMVDLKLLSFTPEQRETLLAMGPGTGPVTIDASTYEWLQEPVQTVGVPVGGYAVNMDDTTAELIVEQFWRQREELAKENPWWAGVRTSQVQTLLAPLHPGVVDYYQSKGVEIPDAMLPDGQ
ncbi:TRAP transporter substrate-binding protein [Rhodovibrio sodomensis]|uniref:TRAP transporter substrate-binding protein n=1 Tax=Rhodovibrio sodomensis TaxID=1088 RepID=A0ABS1DKN9_9PROT|nr:TAXI family TRAP transporter solute-binding subunit [Rhodovibrio sodomensis]MBK1669920.1 TRAP transporter substrate-binding protein [Rhodovibrio sodomensis]